LGFTSKKLDKFDVDIDDVLMWLCDCWRIDCPFTATELPLSIFFFCLRSLARRFWN
jgi:hypothetical protein